MKMSSFSKSRMTYEEFNEFCGSLPAASYVMQWGGSHVWKVGGKNDGKVFAIGGWVDGGKAGFTFKVPDSAYEMLLFRPGLRPAPYLASRGMKWIQHCDESGPSDAELKDFLQTSHRLASLNLTKKKQKELGLNQD
jgi:predicted DNA-binding protein (MmcQ/YjbR family)